MASILTDEDESETEEDKEEEQQEKDFIDQLENLDFNSLKMPTAEAAKAAGNVIASTLKEKVITPSLFATNLERFKYWCKDYPSRELYIDFNFRFLISACLARRVWIGDLKGNPVFGNQFMFFVAKPGMGKSIASKAASKILESLTDTVLDRSANKWVTIKLLNLGPDAITFEKLIDRAQRAGDTAKTKDGKHYSHASTTFCLCDEVDMLFHKDASSVVSFFNKGFDCGDFENDTWKRSVQGIKNICINLLGCTTPKVMKKLMKSGILNAGFTARTIFLFMDKKRPHPPTILHDAAQFNEIEYLRKHLRALCKMPPTQLHFDNDAQAWLDRWHEKYENQGARKANDNAAMEDYYARKKEHIKKLSINFALSDKITDTITVDDIIAAEHLLALAEVDMHKALCGTGDNPMAALAESIVEYLKSNGPTTRNKIIFQFFNESLTGVEGIAAVIDYLVSTEQVKPQQVLNKEGLKYVNTKNEIEKED